MRYNVSLNFDILETNVVNLSVVITVVITVIGENLDLAIKQRKEKIQQIVQRIDKEIAISQEKQIQAHRRRQQADQSCREIRTKSIQILEQDTRKIYTRLEREIAELGKKNQQRIQFENRMKAQLVYRKIRRQSLSQVQTCLLQDLAPVKSRGNYTQVRLNRTLVDKEFLTRITWW